MVGIEPVEGGQNIEFVYEECNVEGDWAQDKSDEGGSVFWSQ